MNHLHRKLTNLINNFHSHGNDSCLVLLHFTVAICVFNDFWAVEIYYYHNNWIYAYFLVYKHLEHINILCIIIIDVDMNSFKLLMKFIRNINGFIDMNLIWVVGITTINYSMCGRNNRKGKNLMIMRVRDEMYNKRIRNNEIEGMAETWYELLVNFDASSNSVPKVFYTRNKISSYWHWCKLQNSWLHHCDVKIIPKVSNFRKLTQEKIYQTRG